MNYMDTQGLDPQVVRALQDLIDALRNETFRLQLQNEELAKCIEQLEDEVDVLEGDANDAELENDELRDRLRALGERP